MKLSNMYLHMLEKQTRMLDKFSLEVSGIRNLVVFCFRLAQGKSFESRSWTSTYLLPVSTLPHFPSSCRLHSSAFSFSFQTATGTAPWQAERPYCDVFSCWASGRYRGKTSSVGRGDELGRRRAVSIQAPWTWCDSENLVAWNALCCSTVLGKSKKYRMNSLTENDMKMNQMKKTQTKCYLI